MARGASRYTKVAALVELVALVVVGANPPAPVIDETAINLFVDGSSLPAPRRGGIGIHLVVVNAQGHEVSHDCPAPGFASATNNEMELLACIEGLRWVAGRYSPIVPSSYSKIIVFTDSLFVAGNIDNAKFNWPRTAWYTRDGNPVINADLWKRLVAAEKKTGMRVKFRWCKGHSASNPHNKVADRLAKASAKAPLQKPVTISRVRRKLTDQITERGSVKPEGQRLRIRIITDRLLKPQKTYVYKYEVTSRSSPYYGKVDTIFSNHMLSAGHEYSVRLNSDPRQPRIAKVFREIERTVP